MSVLGRRLKPWPAVGDLQETALRLHTSVRAAREPSEARVAEGARANLAIGVSCCGVFLGG